MITRIESIRISPLITHASRVIALRVTCIGLHVLIARAQRRHPLRIEVRLPFTVERRPVTLTIPDILEGAW